MNDNVKRLVEMGEELHGIIPAEDGLRKFINVSRVQVELGVTFIKGAKIVDAILTLLSHTPALISALRELDEENARLNELCDAQKNRLEELWEEKARLRAELAAATEDIESIVSGGDPCDFCRNPNGCLWPASCPQKRYKYFTWRGTERSEHNA
jgi:hypothetical protein